MASPVLLVLCSVLLGAVVLPVYAQSFTCVGVGSACNSNCSAPGGAQFCTDSHCDPTSGNCVDVAGFGQACATDGNGPDCLGEQTYYLWASNCLTNNLVCGTNTPPLSAGDACDTTEKDVLNATEGGCPTGSLCNSGKCSSAGGANSTCSLSGPPCDNGFFCAFSTTTFKFTCNPFSQKGDTCSFSAPCVSGLVCGKSGTCIDPLSVAVGSPCSSSNLWFGAGAGSSGSTECVSGAACDFTSGNCIAVDLTKAGMPCNTASDCGTGYSCVGGCGSSNSCVVTVSAWSDTVANAWLAYAQCLGSSGCSTNSLFYNMPFKGTGSENCASANCGTQWAAYVATWARTGAYTECPSGGSTTGAASTGSTMSTMAMTGSSTVTTGATSANPATTNPSGTTTTGSGSTTTITTGATTTTKKSSGALVQPAVVAVSLAIIAAWASA